MIEECPGTFASLGHSHIMALHISTHDKRPGCTELRIYVQVSPDKMHCAGKLSISGFFWRTVLRPMLKAGAESKSLQLTIDESRGPREQWHHPK